MSSADKTCGAKVNEAFVGAFGAWGRFVARRPCAVMVASFLFCCIFLSGFSQFSTETAAEKLWVPQKAPAIDHKAVYDSVYGSGYKREKITITAKGADSNMLRKEVVEEILRFDRELRNMTFTFIDPDTDEEGDVFGFNHACAPGTPEGRNETTGEARCLIIGHPLEYWYQLEGKFVISNITENSDPTPCSFENDRCSVVERINAARGIDKLFYNEASWTNPDRALSPKGKWGGMETNADGKIISAKAMQYAYLMDKDVAVEEIVVQWENRMMDWASNEFESDVIEIFPQSDGAITGELSRTIRGDLLALNIGLFGIMGYVIIALGRFHPTKNRSILAVSGIFTCILAIAVAYGLASMLGLKSTPVTNVLPFILIGIGVDDMFVLCAALDEAEGETVEDRIGEAVGHAGLSVFITSVTDILAFSLGATSQLPALYYFCGFAAIGIFFDFFLQLTFFVGAMVKDAERQEREGKDCMGACCCAPTGVFCCGGKLAQGEHGVLRNFMAKYYTPLFENNIFRGVVIVGCLALAAFMGYGATGLKQDFSFRFFVPDDSYLTDIFDIEDAYFGDLGLPFYTVTVEGDYHTPAVQERYETLIAEIDACTGCSMNDEPFAWVEEGTTSAWYTGFKDWVQDCEDSEARLGAFMATVMPECVGKTLVDGYIPEDSFYPWLGEFLDERAGALFASDLVLDDEDAPTKIIAARFRSVYVAVGKADEQVKSMLDMRAIVDRVQIEGSFPYMFMYLYYEQYAIIMGEAIMNISLALCAVALITFMLLSHFFMATLVMLCVVLVDIDILGLMYFWDLSIDSVCVINLVLAIGLAVDYTVHIAHAFITTPGDSKVKRAQHAVESMGSSVLHGANSTLVAVMVLSTSQSYIFRAFFKMFFGICLFGLLHGMVFLPVVVSLIGPDSVTAEGGHGHASAKVADKSTEMVEKSKEIV